MKDTLLDTVTDEYAAVEAFASILAYEAKVLSQTSPLQLLPSIVDKKTELTEQLVALEKARDTRLAEMGLPHGWNGMELAAGSDARLAEQWGRLKKAALRARRLNTNNGVMIRIRMDYNQRALSVLRGGRAAAKPALYGPDGRMPAYGY